MTINFSYTTFMTSAFFFSLCTILFSLYMRKKKPIFYQKEVILLLLTQGILFFRLMMPIEFSITKSFYLGGSYASICSMLRKNIWLDFSLAEGLFVFDIFIMILIAIYKIYCYQRFCMIIQKHGMILDTITETSFLKRKVIIPVVGISIIQEPFIMGILKHKIIIPEKYFYDFKYIIQHELQHYRNHDLIYKMFLDIISTSFKG